MMTILRQFLKDRKGATAIEYALIAGLISLAIIGSATAVGERLDATFEGVANGFPSAGGGEGEGEGE